MTGGCLLVSVSQFSLVAVTSDGEQNLAYVGPEC